VKATSAAAAGHTPQRVALSGCSGTSLFSECARVRHGLRDLHQFPIATATNGTTNQKYTHTSTGLIVRLPDLFTTPAMTTRAKPASPTAESATDTRGSQRASRSRSGPDPCSRDSGQSTARARNETTIAMPAPTTKNSRGTGRSARPPIPCARAGVAVRPTKSAASERSKTTRPVSRLTGPPVR
jgi:hypothetical protein